MNEIEMQQEIQQLNRKLDLVLEQMEEQKRRRESYDDLFDDLSIISKDAVKNTVIALDKAGFELDTEALTRLGIKLAKNVEMFNNIIETVESANDLIKDVSPIIKQVGLDAINKMAELESEGYLEYFSELLNLMGKFKENFTIHDIQNLTSNIDIIANIARNISKPDILIGIEKASSVIGELKMDEKLDNKSLFKIYGAMNKPDVRTALFYALRIINEIVKNSKNK
ncbi:MAG: hypothetical protein HXX09_01875 [Bacteroidetes bacterium]|nr:hypothetical protein [Bacteroidota bacterium]